MESSDWFGRGALTRPGIEIGPAPRAEASTIVPTQHVRRHGERKLFAHRLPKIERCGLGRQRIDTGIVGGIGIVAEEQTQLDVHRPPDVGEASATVCLTLAVHPPPPEIFAGTRFLQTPIDGHRPCQLEPEPFEDRIVGAEPSDGLDRTTVEISEIDPEHSL
jgi:hypothetical protein